MISIIVPVYNDFGWLSNTLLPSIERQSIGIENIDMIVVDDGSDDFDTIQKELKDQFKFITILHQDHSGAGKARNFGIGHAKGEYLFFPDADCLLYDNCLEKMYNVLSKTQMYQFVYCHFLRVDINGWIQPFKSYRFNQKLLEKVNYISACSLVKKDKEIVWDETLSRFQDWHLWLKLTRKGYKGTLVDESLFFHFLRKTSITQTEKSYEESMKLMYEALNSKSK